MAQPKERVPIRPPKKCSDEFCERVAVRRGMCMMHYNRYRCWAIKLGIWNPQPHGNYGDPEGHRMSGKMGGDKRAEDPASLADAGRKGQAGLIRNNPTALHELAIRGGQALSADREHMRAMGKRGLETRWRKKSNKEGETTT